MWKNQVLHKVQRFITFYNDDFSAFDKFLMANMEVIKYQNINIKWWYMYFVSLNLFLQFLNFWFKNLCLLYLFLAKNWLSLKRTRTIIGTMQKRIRNLLCDAGIIEIKFSSTISEIFTQWNPQICSEMRFLLF